jgi:hypothetical protein
MYPGDADDVRSWTARHGAALRGLISAHAHFLDTVGATRPAEGSPGGAADRDIEAAGQQLMEAGRVVQALPPVPDQQARELLEQFLGSLPAIVAAAADDRDALRGPLLRSSLTMVDLMDRLLPLM